MRHIGIVACSAEGAALCYRTIVHEGTKLLGADRHPEISLHNICLADYMAAGERGDWKTVGDLMLDSARKLAAAGADFLICPDNTVHQAMDYVRPHAPLPWLHIAEVVAEVAKARGFKKIGITGTKYLVASEVYPEALATLGLDFVRPSPARRDAVNGIIFGELVQGRVTPEAVDLLRDTIAELKEAGADAVVLGCTEIPLAINDGNSPLPTLDSTRLLARAALKEAVG